MAKCKTIFYNGTSYNADFIASMPRVQFVAQSTLGSEKAGELYDLVVPPIEIVTEVEKPKKKKTINPEIEDGDNT